MIKTFATICAIIALILIAACATVGPSGNVAALTIDPNNIPLGDGGANVNNADGKLAYDPIFVRDLLENFVAGAEVDRLDISRDLIAVGKPVLAHLIRFLKRDIDENTRLDLLRLQDRIANGVETVKEEAPKPEPGAEEGVKNDDPAKADGKAELPPSTTEAVKAADDLVDIGFEQKEVDAFIYNRYNTALRAFRQHQFDRAIELCQAILTLAPQTRYRKQVLQVMLDAQSGEQTDRRVAGTIAFDRRFASFADAKDGSLSKPLTLMLFLTNVGSKPITIDLGSGGEGNQSILTLSVQLSEESFTDSIRTEGRISIPLVGETIKLEAGQSHNFSIPLNDISGISPGGGAKQLISRVSALGSLRPAKLLVHYADDDIRRVFRPILLSRDEVLVMPAGFDVALAERAPVEFVRKNLEVFDATALQMAHVFVGNENMREVLNLLLADDLRQASTRQQEVRLALAARLTGREYSVKTEDWISWWRDNRFRY